MALENTLYTMHSEGSWTSLGLKLYVCVYGSEKIQK